MLIPIAIIVACTCRALISYRTNFFVDILVSCYKFPQLIPYLVVALVYYNDSHCARLIDLNPFMQVCHSTITCIYVTVEGY